VLNPIQILALNLLVTVGLCAILTVAGMALVPAFLWSWIGGAVITLYCAVVFVAVAERRHVALKDAGLKTERDRNIAIWEEDARDDLWEKTARDVKRAPEVTAPSQDVARCSRPG
jgi:hypothetical protein